MKLGVYSIRDVHTGFCTPTFEANDRVAWRNFQHASMNPDTILATHPTDFQLLKLATFDSETGEFISQLPAVVSFGGDSLV